MNALSAIEQVQALTALVHRQLALDSLSPAARALEEKAIIAEFERLRAAPAGPAPTERALRFAYDGGGIGKGGMATLEVDGKPVAEGRIERTIPIRVTLDESLDVGEDTGTPVTTSYDVPFRFDGKVDRVVIDLE